MSFKLDLLDELSSEIETIVSWYEIALFTETQIIKKAIPCDNKKTNNLSI